MAVKRQKEKTIFESLLEFTLKYRVPLTVLLAVVIVFAAIAITMNYIDTANTQKADRQFDAAQFNLISLLYITNENERSAVYQQQIQSLESLVRIYPRTVAAERARFLIGKFYFEGFFNSGNTRMLEEAYSNYNFAYLAARTDFYRTLALIGRAEAREQENKYDNAFSDYSLVSSKYSNQGFAAYALIGMARCREQMSDIPSAVELYHRIISDYPDSEWTRFAKGRIYYYTENAVKSGATNTNVQFILPQ